MIVNSIDLIVIIVIYCIVSLIVKPIESDYIS